MTNGSSSSAWQDICSSLIFCSRTADESIGQVRDSLTQRLYHFDEHATIALPFDHETLNHQLVPPISATVTRMCLQRLLAPLCEAWGLLDGLCRRVRRDLAVEGGFPPRVDRGVGGRDGTWMEGERPLGSKDV